MKKIYINVFIAITIVLVTLVSASVITNFNLTPVVFTPEDGAKQAPTQETITYDCGATKGLTLEASEPDGKWDNNDLQKVLNSAGCKEAITNIKMNGLTYQKNKYGTKSFDEQYLKKDECQKDGNHVWNDNSCNDISEEEDCTSHAKFWYDNNCNDKEQVIEDPDPEQVEP